MDKIKSTVIQERSAPDLRGKSSYGHILMSSALIGGASLVNVLLGVVRMKVVAVLLGPAGFGLTGLFISISDLVQALFGVGVNSSGVRQIAASAGNGDPGRVTTTLSAVRRLSFLLGICSAVLLAVFCEPVSQLTFGSREYALPVALLGTVVLFRLLAGAESAVLQGLRKIGALAKVSILGGVLGTLATIGFVFWFKENGIVPGLISVAVLAFAISWWYARRIPVPTGAFARTELISESVSLLKLGAAFMVSSLLGMACAYVIRAAVLRASGLEAAGFYQAAWTVGGLYVGFILQAMGSDFYPRLTAAIDDHAEANRIVNEQAHVSLLLAGPGVLTTLCFSELALSLLYSSKFHAAVGVLRWIALGMAMRIITWPLGFVIMAKARQNLLIATEFAWACAHLGLAVPFIQIFGVEGAGMAFFASYVVHAIFVYPIACHLIRFRWSSKCWQAGIVFAGSVCTAMLAAYALTGLPLFVISVVLVFGSALYSVLALRDLVACQVQPRWLKWMFKSSPIS